MKNVDDDSRVERPEATGAEIAFIQRSSEHSPYIPVTERVVEELRSYIAENGFEPGHKLPPERIFLTRLGVSRSTLREALRVLATLGLIDVRHGDGMYVAAAADVWRASPNAIFDATEEHALRNLVETRLGIEMAAVTVAAQRATDDDLKGLQAFVDAQERGLEKGRAWAPLGFELAFVEITGNSWLYEVEVQLRDAWLSLSTGLRASVGRYEEWLAEHRAIVASIRARNPIQAQRLVAAHLSLERFDDDLRTSAGAKVGRAGTASKGRRAS